MGVMPGSGAGATHVRGVAVEGEGNEPPTPLSPLRCTAVVTATAFSPLPAKIRRVPLSREAHLTVGLEGSPRSRVLRQFATTSPRPVAPPVAELEAVQELRRLPQLLMLRVLLQPGLQPGLFGKPVRLSVGGEASSSSLSSARSRWWDPGMGPDTQGGECSAPCPMTMRFLWPVV